MGGFGPQLGFASTGVPYYIASGDFDSDQKTDLVVTSPLNNNISVFFNTSTSSGNRPPIANAVSGQTLECASPGGALATLDGSKSSDPDGDRLSFVWKDRQTGL